MKKILLLLLITLTITSLTGCSDEKETNEPTELELKLQEDYPDLDFSNLEYMLDVGGFQIYESDNAAEACDTPVSYELDGYQFQTSSGCEESFLALGIIGIRDNVAYSIETLISIGRVTPEFMYQVMYNDLDTESMSFDNQVQLDLFSHAYSQSEDVYGVYIYFEDSMSNIRLSQDIDNLIEENPFKIFALKLEGLEYETYVSTLAIFENGVNTHNFIDTAPIKDFVTEVISSGFTLDQSDSNIELIRSENLLDYNSFPSFLTEIEGYKIYNNLVFTNKCSTGFSFTIDGHLYTSSTACAPTFDAFGYTAVKDNTVFSVDHLINNDIISYEQINNSLGAINIGLEYSDVRLNHITDTQSIFTQNEDDYYVYIYSLTCSFCESLKPDILEYILNETTLDFYVGGVQSMDTTGINEYISGVPALLHIVNGELTEVFSGTDEIADFMNNN